MTNPDIKKLIEESKARTEKYEKEWLRLKKILDKQDNKLEKQLQLLGEGIKRMDERKQRRKVKGRLLSHEFEDIDLDEWK